MNNDSEFKRTKRGPEPHWNPEKPQIMSVRFQDGYYANERIKKEAA